MIRPDNPKAASGRPVRGSGAGTSRYFFFFAMQTIGAGILFWYAVPLYRQVLADPGGHEARPERLIWSLSSIGLMQAGYWMRHRFNPPLPQFRNALIGHIILFVGSISFVFAGAVFCFAFIVPRPELQIPSLSLSRSDYGFVCLVLLRAGTSATGKGTQRSEANTGRYRMSDYMGAKSNRPAGPSSRIFAPHPRKISS